MIVVVVVVVRMKKMSRRRRRKKRRKKKKKTKRGCGILRRYHCSFFFSFFLPSSAWHFIDYSYSWSLFFFATRTAPAYARGRRTPGESSIEAARRRSSGGVHHDTAESSLLLKKNVLLMTLRRRKRRGSAIARWRSTTTSFIENGKYAPGGLGVGETFAWSQVIRNSNIAEDTIKKSPELLEPFEHEGEHRVFSR